MEFGDIAVGTHKRGVERKQREQKKREEAERLHEGERGERELNEGPKDGGNRLEKVRCQSSFQLCRKKGKMTNIFLSDSDEKVTADFVKGHKQLYDKTN